MGTECKISLSQGRAPSDLVRGGQAGITNLGWGTASGDNKTCEMACGWRHHLTWESPEKHAYFGGRLKSDLMVSLSAVELRFGI